MKKLLVLFLIVECFNSNRCFAQNLYGTKTSVIQDSLPDLPWHSKSGAGIGLGISMTNMGGLLTLGADFRVPLSNHFAIGIRPIIIPAIGDTATLSAGGRIEFEFRSTVMLNILRVYAAAGPQAFYGLKGPGKDEFDWSGGWVFGFEVFFSAAISLHFDIGTSGGTVDNEGNGLTVGTGFLYYPFLVKRR
jgi:hypothetical protein